VVTRTRPAETLIIPKLGNPAHPPVICLLRYQREYSSHQPCHVPMSHGASHVCPSYNCLVCRYSTGRMQGPGPRGKTIVEATNQYRTLHLQKCSMAMCPSASWILRLQSSICTQIHVSVHMHLTSPGIFQPFTRLGSDTWQAFFYPGPEYRVTVIDKSKLVYPARSIRQQFIP
jgi:hypothetical protein